MTLATVAGTATRNAPDITAGLSQFLFHGTRSYLYGLGLLYSINPQGTASPAAKPKATATAGPRAVATTSPDNLITHVRVYHTDGLGSVRALTDEYGTLTATYQTDAFGANAQQQGLNPQPFGYAGQQTDNDGLVYLRARYYDPNTGRFMSRDPTAGAAALPLSLNRYTYVRNNPGLNADPSGRCGPACAILAPGAIPGVGEVYLTALAVAGAVVLVGAGVVALAHHFADVPSASAPTAPTAGPDFANPTPGPGGEPRTVDVDPNGIRFSQSSVNDVAGIIDNMRANGWIGAPIDVVRMPDGSLTTIDNSRLLAAREAGIDARVLIHDFNDPLPADQVRRFATPRGGTPTSWGEAAVNRIRNQSAAYRNANPYGSDVIGWNGS